MKKRIICLALAIILALSSISAVAADDTLQSKLEAALKGSGTIISIAGDLIKYAASKFKDVKENDWYAEYIGKLNVLGIIDGFQGMFNPSGNVTRAEFIKMLVQAMDYKKVDAVSFNDLKPLPAGKAHWSSVYIETALRNGVIIKDEQGESFYPDAPLTRLDMAVMVCRALKLKPSEGENPFVDITQANGYVTRVYEEYIVMGNLEGGKWLYKPEGLTNRAEAAAILSRLVDYKTNPAGYKASMSAEDTYKDLITKIKTGNYTEDDLIAKSKIELEKQKINKTYIPEPILKVDHVSDTTLHARITLLNYRDYSNDFMIKMHCTNYTDINSIRTNSLVGLRTTLQNDWKDGKRAGIATLFDIRERNGKFVGKTCEYFSYNFMPGTIFNFDITYKRNNTDKSLNYSVTIK